MASSGYSYHIKEQSAVVIMSSTICPHTQWHCTPYTSQMA